MAEPQGLNINLKWRMMIIPSMKMKMRILILMIINSFMMLLKMTMSLSNNSCSSLIMVARPFRIQRITMTLVTTLPMRTISRCTNSSSQSITSSSKIYCRRILTFPPLPVTVSRDSSNN